MQREISPCTLRTFTRAEMRALRKRSLLLGLAAEKKEAAAITVQDLRTPHVCLPVVRSRGKVRRDRRLAMWFPRRPRRPRAL